MVLMTAAVMTASAQPKTKLRPSQTVLLYADSFEGNTDPVYSDEIVYAGFEMAEKTGLTGPEEIQASGNITNISDLARVDIYLPLGTEVLVKLGDRTVGNETVIAKLA